MAPAMTAPETPMTRDQQIAALEAQLEKAQRLSALGELLGTTTHEFNNLLTTIINYAKIGMRHKDEASRDKSFEKILGASDRAARICRSVLGAARNRTDSFAPVLLVELVEESLLLLEKDLSKYKVSVERIFSPAPAVRACANQIQQVFLNMVINARQAMPLGGRLIIRIEHDSASGLVDLAIRDTGSGIPEAQLRRIFDPYFTTKSGPDEEGQGGSGLGLAACKRIIEAHQGRIRVETAVGKGTCFTLRLPVAVVNAAMAPPLGVPNSLNVADLANS
jgi:signal transduction histidine kinase